MPVEYIYTDQKFLLLPEKALFWENEKALILADLHLGKASHFRKAGLAIPAQSSQKDYITLHSLVSQYQPDRVLILGDLFHSDFNNEWEIFGNFIQQHHGIQFELVVGNHDILPLIKYQEIGLKIHGETLIYENLIFTHHPLQSVPENHLNFSGHIHPGVRLEGAARQSITMPCFYKNENNFILPAFGSLTGLKILNKTPSTDIFGVSGSKIFKI